MLPSAGAAQRQGAGLSYFVEDFTDDEAQLIRPYVTNLDRPVFALRSLPEVTKGALFARYSRTNKSLRRLLVDEFLDGAEPGHTAADAGTERAEGFYERVLTDYGDDSVAQLGFAHVACEQASNVLTKVIERGRLAAYLEQSTRYLPFDKPLGGRYRYAREPDIEASPLARAYEETLDSIFRTYSELVVVVETYLAARFPRAADDPEPVWRRTIRAKAFDALRGLLPAATLSNVGMAASGQAFEALLLRMAASPLAEARVYGAMMKEELDAVVPAFVRRVDVAERGGAWSAHLAETRKALEGLATELGLHDAEADLPASPEALPPNAGVTLTDWDPDGETKLAAAALYPYSTLPDDVLLAEVRALSMADRARVIAAAVGTRGNRRHRPGRGFERVGYRFDVVADYGAFRDLQRHRLLTIEWQPLSASPALGYDVPEVVDEAGAGPRFREALTRSADLYHRLLPDFPHAAQYAVSLAYRMRFVMHMNAREAFHVVELRSSAQGHPAYRRVAQAMHDTIAEVHPAVAAAMTFVDRGAVDLERLEAERRSERRRQEAASNPS